MNYNEVSDFEVNEVLDNLIANPDWLRKRDYCNNWSDIGPLIEKYSLDVQPPFKGSHWFVSDLDDEVVVRSTNPKRAAAICIIKLLEARL